MKPRIIAACAAVAIAAFAAGAALRPSQAPEARFNTLAGEHFSTSDLRGKVVLVNFWATWCEPCVAEMPALQALRDALAPNGFEVLGVNFQEGPTRIDAFVRKTGISFPVVRDTDGAVVRAWNARVFPSSFVVDREGRVRYVMVGEGDWTSPTLVSTIRSLLGPQPAR
jgi:thiol-disulfide isomerase/thioredoxin